MWKVNVPIMLLLVLLSVTGCGAGEEKKSEVMLYEEGSKVKVETADVAYDTVVAEEKTYKESFDNTGDLDYTDTAELFIEEDDAVLDSLKVKKDQKINKGDVIGTYHIETSKTKLQKQKLLLNQAVANYESGLSNLNTNLSAAKKNYSLLTSQAEKKIKMLEIKKMEKEIATYKKGKKEVDKQRKDYNKLVRMQKKTNFIAKSSGVVTSVDKSKVGENISASDMLVHIRKNDRWLIKVTDPESKLRYNMKVKVRLGKNVKNFDTEVDGKVITAADITGVSETDDDGNNVIYIRVSKEDREKYDFENTNIYIHAVSFKLEKSIIVPADAVYKESVENTNKLYVYIVENDKLHKRYIVSSYSNEEEYLVDQGVKEGQTLAILRN